MKKFTDIKDSAYVYCCNLGIQFIQQTTMIVILTTIHQVKIFYKMKHHHLMHRQMLPFSPRQVEILKTIKINQVA